MVLPETPSTLPKQLSPFLIRAKEVESADPTISYFCKLYTVEQILNQGLHTSDESISTFAIALLDDIENFKTQSKQELLDIINDHERSQLYIINFSDKIFNNSLGQIHSKKSGKGTALGFLASVNFYELLKLWEDKDKQTIDQEEVVKKTRYAKFHAARILKSLKKGEDPNEYDPPELNPVEDEEELAGLGQSGEVAKKDNEQDDIVSYHDTPEPEKDELELGLPQVPKFIDEAPTPPPVTSIDTETKGPEDHKEEKKDTKESTPDFQLPNTPKYKPEPPKPTEPKVSSKPKASQPETTQSDINKWIESGEIYTKAQKHAKFAISAMNYEDKETAIKQLTNALDLLSNL